MLRQATPILLGAALLAGAAPAMAADLYVPPVIETPPPVYYEPEKPDFGGWYIRGDLDYHFLGFRGGTYITYGCPGCGPTPGTNSFDTGTLRSTFSAGGGIGYQVNRYFRVDLTGDYLFGSQFTGSTSGDTCGPGGGPCTSTDTSTFSALLLLANAYAELGTWHRITPYLGAGLGGARVAWGDLTNVTDTTSVHAGATSWRFAWALMAGASYCLTDKFKLDVGYRYTRISGGRMFEWGPAGAAIGAGPGFDAGIDVHEARAGLRYSFGGNPACAPKEHIPYEPQIAVYK